MRPARAGEAGKGFSVVAEEVRNLANRSADAATQTTSQITNSLKAIDDGRRIVNTMAASFQSINDKTVSTHTLVESISAASDEQSEAIKKIQRLIDDITRVVQNNAATAEESSAASEELSAQADTLDTEVSKGDYPLWWGLGQSPSKSPRAAPRYPTTS